VHFLLIPKAHIPSLAQVTPAHADMMGHMMALIPRLALQEGCNPYPDGGYRVVTNTGTEGGQEVHHMHFHVMGGSRPWLRG
jgi:histidine triad (HIT) family protein